MNIKEFSKKIGVPISTISKALGGYKDVNINTKNKSTKQMLDIRRISRLSSLSLIKLLLINVKNVKKPKEIVIINITMINKFLFNRVNIP